MDEGKQSPTGQYLIKLFNKAETDCIELHGKCQSCEEPVDLVIWKKGFETEGNGGMIVSAEFDPRPEFKCTKCLERDNYRISPTRCEIFTRVCGYLRPIQSFNPGKREEFKDRKTYKNPPDSTAPYNLELTKRPEMESEMEIIKHHTTDW